MYFSIEQTFPPHPQCFGARCEACGAPDRENVRVVRASSVSIDHQDGQYGPAFFCEWCVWEWAHALGMLRPAEAAEIVASSATKDERIAELEAEVAILAPVRAAIEAFARPDEPPADEPVKRGPGRPRKEPVS